DCSLYFLPVEFQFGDVFEVQLEPLGHRRADHDGVVPGQLGQRLRQLLQPSVVREAAVVDRGIATEVDLDVGVWSVEVELKCPRNCDAGSLQRHTLRRESCTGDPAVV